MDMPVMLQTTAAVHPGASGGVLVNSHGRMVGLITRYMTELIDNPQLGYSFTNFCGGYVLFEK